MLRPAQPDTRRIPSLDGLRALSFLIVFFSHVGFGHIFPGLFGVAVFFFISGFLITTLLCREWQATQGIAIKAFYVRRAVRILPPMLITLAVAVALFLAGLAPGEFDPMTLAGQALFFTNYHQVYGDYREIFGLDVYWSLAVEEHFYMIWPLLFVPVYTRTRRPILWMLVTVAAFTLWRWVQFSQFGATELDIGHASDTRFDAMLVGCFSAIAFLQWDKRQVRLHGWQILALTALGVGALLATFVIRDAMFRAVLRYSVQGLALVPLFYLATRFADYPLYRLLNLRWLMALGGISYALYLIHKVLIGVFEAMPVVQDSRAAIVLASGVGSLAFAIAMKRLVEDPLMRIRKAWRTG